MNIPLLDAKPMDCVQVNCNTFRFSDLFMAWLSPTATIKDMPESAVLAQAVRMYSAVDYHLRQGHKLTWLDENGQPLELPGKLAPYQPPVATTTATPPSPSQDKETCPECGRVLGKQPDECGECFQHRVEMEQDDQRE